MENDSNISPNSDLDLHDLKKNEIPLNEIIINYSKVNRPLLYILTPMYGGVCHIGYLMCLISTIELFKEYGIDLKVEFCRNDSLITRARNNLIAKAMSNKNTTHMIFIDSDISWEPIDIIKLMISEKNLIGGVYPLKKYDFSKLIKDERDPSNLNVINSIIANKSSSPFTKNASDEDLIRYNLLNYNMNYLSTVLNIENNLAKVRHIASGFMMMKRELINSMFLAYPSTKYTDDVGFLQSEENENAYALFDCAIEDGHYLSEDWYFCSRYKKLGGDIFIDVTINLTHTGTEDYKGSYISSIIQRL